MKLWGLVVGLSALATPAIFSCNAILGVSDNAALRDAGSTRDGVVVGPNGACQQDTDCPAIGCYLGQCDDEVHVCRYGLCRGRSDICQRGTCTGNVCSQSRIPYNFESSEIAIDGISLGCGGDPTSCTVAVYPYVIVGATNGLQLVAVADITNASPTQFFVSLPFAPTLLVASPPNVYALGSLANNSLQVAVVVIPVDPTTAALTATTVTMQYPYDQVAAFPGPAGGLFLVDQDSSEQFPVALVRPPLPANAAVVAPTITEPAADGGRFDAGQAALSVPDGGYAMYQSPGPGPGASIVGPSGSRLVYESTVGYFGLVQWAGTPNANFTRPTTTEELPTTILPNSGSFTWSAPAGTLAWAYSAWGVGYDCNCQYGTSLSFLYHGATEDYLNNELGFAPLEEYTYSCSVQMVDGGCSSHVAPPPSAPLPYPYAQTVIGTESALALVINTTSSSPTSVGLFIRGYGWANRPLTQQVDIRTQPVGFAGSNNLGFLLATSPGLGLTILDPSCP